MSEETPKKEAPTVDGINKLADANFNALVNLVGVHIQSYLNSLTSNRLAGRDKMTGAQNLTTALKAALNFGVNEKAFALPKGGFGATEATKCAAILAQALDARMLKLAQNMALKDAEAAAAPTEAEVAVTDEVNETNENKESDDVE